MNVQKDTIWETEELRLKWYDHIKEFVMKDYPEH